MLCLTGIYWLAVHLAHRVRQAKDGTFREAYAPYLEDPRYPTQKTHIASDLSRAVIGL
jgi:hypothetical protein